MNYLSDRKLNIPLVIVTRFYFNVPKNKFYPLNSTHYFIMKPPNKKQELQQTVLTHSLDINLRDFMNLYKKCTAKPYSFSVINTTLASDNPFCFRSNLLERI